MDDTILTELDALRRLLHSRRTPLRRTVYPPGSSTIGLGSSVLSVELADDEDVVWHWTHFMDGRSVVTGYSIVKKEKKTLTPKE